MRTVTLSTGERLEVRQAPLAALGPLISAFGDSAFSEQENVRAS